MKTALKWLYATILGGLLVVGILFVWLHLHTVHGWKI
ncbi:hypothetical protein SAMN05443507_10139 [Alicyclobacillus tolerans]|uniref:Uncharacterized protein n=1 Tax=Alicyclobacillus tolerans TaxID=90970 RepID=A0A1M6JSH0_9BACL|nr:hypothetical protein SAMN05443507_10139 [Alicyclobacillus montanus]